MSAYTSTPTYLLMGSPWLMNACVNLVPQPTSRTSWRDRSATPSIRQRCRMRNSALSSAAAGSRRAAVLRLNRPGISNVGMSRSCREVAWIEQLDVEAPMLGASTRVHGAAALPAQVEREAIQLDVELVVTRDAGPQAVVGLERLAAVGEPRCPQVPTEQLYQLGTELLEVLLHTPDVDALHQVALGALEVGVIEVNRREEAVGHLPRGDREHLDHVVLDEAPEPDRIGVDPLQGSLAERRIPLPDVAERGQCPLDRVAQHRHRDEGDTE